jgi:hypothetical protein
MPAQRRDVLIAPYIESGPGADAHKNCMAEDVHAAACVDNHFARRPGAAASTFDSEFWPCAWCPGGSALLRVLSVRSAGCGSRDPPGCTPGKTPFATQHE